MEPELKKAMTEYANNIMKNYDNLFSLREPVKHARFLADRYPEFKPNINSISYYGPSVSMWLHNIESLKDDLAPLLDDLITLGYDPSKYEDYDGYRVHNCGMIKLYCFLKSGTEKCLKVVTDSHTYTNHSYKYVCL